MKMKIRKLLLLACSAISTAGCVSNFQDSTKTDAATIVFRKEGDFTAQAFIYDGAAECTNRHKLPMMTAAKEIASKVDTRAPLSFSMFYTKNMGIAERYCVATRTFTPEPSHRYLASLSVIDGHCQLNLSDEGTPASPIDPPSRIESQTKSWKRALSEQGPFC